MPNRPDEPTRRTPVTDPEHIVGYPVAVQQPTRVEAIAPELAAHIRAFLDARRRRCDVSPRIITEVDARATVQAHRHYTTSPCLQRRAALEWLKEHNKIVPASQFDGVAS
jgi:hypothetical protein